MKIDIDFTDLEVMLIHLALNYYKENESCEWEKNVEKLCKKYEKWLDIREKKFTD